MIHIYLNNKSDKTLIMLHGTGGNEHQMVNLAKTIDNSANILSIRGNVNEAGLNRYFKRFDVGLYDIDNYIKESNNLVKAIKDLSNHYKFDLEKATIVGFSNGANIALGLIQIDPIINNYILLSPDYINKDKAFNKIANKNIFISTSKNDPYVDNDNMDLMLKRLHDAHVNLETIYIEGHTINKDLIDKVIKWYKTI